ncbi:hypothetical protein TYM08_P2495 [Marinicellulosiphila megalodicopiae]
MERESSKKLTGRIRIDDTYLSGERTDGKRGRGYENKIPFVAAAQTDQAGQSQKLKLQLVDGFKKKSIKEWTEKSIDPNSLVVSDGLACFSEATKAPCVHEKHVCGGDRASVEKEEFYRVNTTLGNLKNALRSTLH